MKMNKAGFTLIELLVVIAIIGILMAITVPSITKTRERAMRMKARTECHAIKNAVQGYFNEYGKYPLQTGTSGGANQKLDEELTKILRGRDDAKNPRKIVFLAANEQSLREVKNGKAAEKAGEQMWSPLLDNSRNSRPYMVNMDYDFNNEVPNPNGGTLSGTSVAVWVPKLSGESKIDINTWD